MTIEQDKDKIVEFLIGSDPEVFLQDRETKEIVSAIPYVMGDKHEPYQIPDLPKGCCIQTDNIMVEYCLPATKSPEEFVENLELCKQFTNDIIPANLEVVIKASGRLNEKYLKDKKSQQFGCDPDFNAWADGFQNESPSNKTNLRTCGGHIHIGYNNHSMDKSMQLIKALDIFLGVPSILLDPDKERKKMYGKAGAFRFKDYGVEYRSLSNFWIKDLELVKWTFAGVQNAINFVNRKLVNKLTDTQQNEIETCINTGDEALSHKLMNEFGLIEVLAKSSIYID